MPLTNQNQYNSSKNQQTEDYAKLLLDIQRQRAMMNIVKHEMNEIKPDVDCSSIMSISDVNQNRIVNRGGVMQGRAKVLFGAVMVAALLVSTAVTVAAASGRRSRVAESGRMMPVVNVVGEMPRLVMDTVEVRAERVVRPAEVVEVGSQRRRA
jgi:hypothetical protein